MRQPGLAAKPSRYPLPPPFNRARHVHLFPRRPVSGRLFACLVVVVPAILVHPAPWWQPTALAAAQPAAATNETLPRSTAEMRDAILSAVASGKLADLKSALELNEMRPDIGDDANGEPVAFWTKASKDGKGSDILLALGKMLALKPAQVPLGRDIENNAIYVWPYLAERDLAQLSATEESDLASLMDPSEAAALKAGKRWTWWRLTIGADGTWHAFRKEK